VSSDRDTDKEQHKIAWKGCTKEETDIGGQVKVPPTLVLLLTFGFRVEEIQREEEVIDHGECTIKQMDCIIVHSIVLGVEEQLLRDAMLVSWQILLHESLLVSPLHSLHFM
jgi:hypothetical protein